MGLDCSSPRKPILNQISYDILQQIKRQYPQISKVLKQSPSPVITTPIVKIKDKTYLKLENLQASGSFKIRGAYLYFQNYGSQQIVVASTGNFAKACYFAYQSLQSDSQQLDSQILQQKEQKELYGDTPTPNPNFEFQKDKKFQEQMDKSSLVIFVPENVNQVKLKDILCPIVFQGKDCLVSEEKAKEYAKNHGSVYASPYNDINMILGSCTIGEELDQYFKDCETELDYVFVSCGGGGLIGGIALYFKYLKQTKTRIIGVQPKINAAMYNILKGKQEYQLAPTISDGTSGGVEDSAITIQICKYLVDDWILIREEQIKEAQQKLLNEQKIIVEGAAALAYAGFLTYPIGQCVCAIVLCGSNVDPQNIIKVNV